MLEQAAGDRADRAVPHGHQCLLRPSPKQGAGWEQTHPGQRPRAPPACSAARPLLPPSRNIRRTALPSGPSLPCGMHRLCLQLQAGGLESCGLGGVLTPVPPVGGAVWSVLSGHSALWTWVS